MDSRRPSPCARACNVAHRIQLLVSTQRTVQERSIAIRSSGLLTRGWGGKLQLDGALSAGILEFLSEARCNSRPVPRLYACREWSAKAPALRKAPPRLNHPGQGRSSIEKMMASFSSAED